MTMPVDSLCRPNNLCGYAGFHGTEPMMMENMPFFEQIDFFSGLKYGNLLTNRFYALRAAYTFLATLITPALGPIHACLVLNWLCWALSALITWKLAQELFGDRLTSLIAVAFASCGMGMVIHIGDYSAHLMSFTSFYLGIYLVYHSRVLFESKGLRTHLFLGAYCALASLIYNNGVMLLAIYFLAAWRFNRWRHVVPACVLALSSRRLWQFSMAAFGVPVQDVEGQMIATGLEKWLDLTRAPLGTMVSSALTYVTEFVLMDSPLVVMVGLFSCFFLAKERRRLTWFTFLVLGIPVASCLVFAMVATARGYLVYGASIWIYCFLARLVALGIRQGRAARVISLMALGMLLISHLTWNTAHFWNHLGPAKIFFLGWDVGLPLLKHGPIPYESMTGHERSPVRASLSATWRQAGVRETPASIQIERDEVSWFRALKRRLPIFGYFMLVCLIGIHSFRGQAAVALTGLAALLIGCTLSVASFRSTPAMAHYQRALTLPPNSQLIYHINLSKHFRDHFVNDHDSFCFFVAPLTSGVRVQADAVDIDVALDPKQKCEWIPRNLDSARRLLSQASELRITISNETSQPMDVHGWQRSDLPGRAAFLSPGDIPLDERQPLPAIEVRFSRPDGTLKRFGF